MTGKVGVYAFALSFFGQNINGNLRPDIFHRIALAETQVLVDFFSIFGYSIHRNIAQEFRVRLFAVLTDYSLSDVFIFLTPSLCLISNMTKGAIPFCIRSGGNAPVRCVFEDYSSVDSELLLSSRSNHCTIISSTVELCLYQPPRMETRRNHLS